MTWTKRAEVISCSLKVGLLRHFTFENIQLEFKGTWFLTVRRFNASLKLRPLQSLPSSENSAQYLRVSYSRCKEKYELNTIPWHYCVFVQSLSLKLSCKWKNRHREICAMNVQCHHTWIFKERHWPSRSLIKSFR